MACGGGTKPRGPDRADCSFRFQDLCERFDRTGRAVPVDFQGMVGPLSLEQRATHHIHPYPAKLIPHIPWFFLRVDELSEPGAVVLDPFCGSGTVLLEAILNGRRALGADSNPVARLVAAVKATPLDVRRLRGAGARLLDRAGRSATRPRPALTNSERWFSERVAAQLHRLHDAVEATRAPELRNFFRVCYSSCVRQVSLADPRVSVPVQLNPKRFPRDHWYRAKAEARVRWLSTVDVIGVFGSIVEANTRRAAALATRAAALPTGQIVSDDARCLRRRGDYAGVRDESVDLIVTSPPYLGAQKYIRASTLSLGWLGELEQASLQDLMRSSIGREQYRKAELDPDARTGLGVDRTLARVRRTSPLRAHIATQYLLDMDAALRECVRVLKPGASLVLVAGNNHLCGEPFRTEAYLRQLASRAGLRTRVRLVDRIKSRGLMTRRNKTASVISREWLTVFTKDAT